MKFKKIIYYFLIALMISSLIMLGLIFIKQPRIRKESRLTAIPNEFIEVKKDESFFQYFQVQTDTIDILKININNVINPKGNLKLTFYNDKGEELSVHETELKQFVTPSINFIKINSIDNIKNEVIQIKFEVTDPDSIVSIGANNEYYENQYIKKDNKRINKSINMYYEGYASNPSLIVHFLLIFFVSLILYVFLKEEIIQEGNDKHEKNKRK